jgi:hypothetical protein
VNADRVRALLTALVEAQHAALYGYGVLGARLDDDGRLQARAAADVHRRARDTLSARLRDLGAPVPASLPAYDVEVADAPRALALAVRLEAGLGVRWRDLVAGTDDPALRRLGVEGLTQAAVRAAQWRRLAGAAAVTVAFPGTA